MLQNQNLTEFAQYWGDVLIGDLEIQAYCGEKFHKKMSVIIAPPEHALPGAEDAPCIFLHNPEKQEGMNNTKCLYSLIISVGIVTEDDDIVSAAGTKVKAGQKYMSDLLELIQAAIYTDCKAPARIEQGIPALGGANLSYWAGFLSVTWEIDIPLGATNYFE